MKLISRMINEKRYFLQVHIAHMKADNDSLFELFVLDPL